jgi:E3 ubiquitin-protein ligase UBR2
MDNVSLSTQQTGELFAPSQRLKRHRSSSDSSSSDSKLRHQQQDFCSDLMNWIHDIGIQAVDARRIATEHQHHPSPPHPPHPPNQPPPATPLSVSQSSIVSDPSGSNLDTEIPVSQLEEKFGLGSVVLDEKTKWLEDGLGSLCMAIHKVACGATERSRPERYTRSASNALFHTLICTFLTPTFMTVMPTTSGVLSIPSSSPTTSSMIPSSSDHLQAELRFLKAMKFIPLLLDKVVKKSTRQKLLKLSYNNTLEWNAEIKSLLHFGGSEITEEGTIVLEEEHPSTQTQTRKQSLWGKVRWPKKPLLLTHLGGVLSQALLLAPNEVDAVHSARLIVLARLIQTLVWTLLSRQHDFAHGIHQREYRKEEVAFFIQVFFDEPSHTTVEHAAEQVWALSERLFAELNGIEWTTDDQEGSVKDVLGKKQLLNLVACEVVPMVKVASFLLYSLYSTDAAGNGLAKPTQLSIDQVNRIGFIKLDAFTSGNGTSPREMGTSGGILSIQQGLFVLVSRWIKRFKTGYEEMNDPQGLLHQWLTGVNIGNGFKLTFPIILLRDLNTVHRSLSALCAGFSRTSYLRSLPRAYVKFYAHLAKRKCESCHQFPSRPAVCLLCGMLLCAANTCPSIQQDKGYPEEANPGACTIHAKKCGRGVGMFLLVLEGAVLLVYWKLAAYVGSLYVDEYGEEFGERNRDLSKGRPLYLQEERRERLMRLWLRHEIPNEVVKIQNSSDRVIRNSHY